MLSMKIAKICKLIKLRVKRLFIIANMSRIHTVNKIML